MKSVESTAVNGAPGLTLIPESIEDQDVPRLYT
jgi:hypothetical protein